MNFLTEKAFYEAISMDALPQRVSMFYDLNYKIAVCLNDYRERYNLTQTALGKLLGTKQSTVAKLENGDYNFTLRTLCDVFDKLDMDLELSISERAVKRSMDTESALDDEIYDLKRVVDAA